MLALIFPPIPSLVALLIAVAVPLIAPKGRGAMAFVGSSLVFLGVGFLMIGKIPQRWGGGFPVEGSLATFGSLFIVCFGVGIILVVFLKKSDDHTQST